MSTTPIIFYIINRLSGGGGAFSAPTNFEKLHKPWFSPEFNEISWLFLKSNYVSPRFEIFWISLPVWPLEAISGGYCPPKNDIFHNFYKNSKKMDIFDFN